MHQTIGFYIILPFFTMLTGCMVNTRFVMNNGSGEDIVVKSHHTQQEVKIADGECRSVPHTAGNVTVYRGEDIWLYDDMSPLEFRDTEWMHSTWFLYPSLTVRLYLDRTGLLYVIPKGSSKCNVHEMREVQSPGYPKKPLVIDNGWKAVESMERQAGASASDLTLRGELRQ